MDFSEDIDVEQSLCMKRMKQKGGKGRRTKEKHFIASCPSKPGTGHSEGCKVVGSLLYLFSF